MDSGRAGKIVLAAIATGFVLAIAGCDQPTNADRAADLSRKEAREKLLAARQAEAALMSNTATAGPELEQRLAQRVQRTGSVLIIHERRLPPNSEGTQPESKDFAVTAVPFASPWMVKCSNQGISVTFGGPSSGDVSGGDGSVGADVAVELSNAQFTRSQCDELVPIVANVMVLTSIP